MKGSALFPSEIRAGKCDDIPCGDRSVYTSVRASARRCLLCTTLPIYLPWRRTDAFKGAQVPTSQLPLHARHPARIYLTRGMAWPTRVPRT